jgi:hypothetical protein
MPIYEYQCKPFAGSFNCGLRRSGLTKFIFLVAVAGAMAIPSSGQSGPSASTKSGAPAAAARNWIPPKTAWGDPDLQGMWPNTDLLGVPLQRDPKLGTRALLTDAEYAQREARAKRSDEGLNQKYDKLDGPVSTGSPIWWIEHGRPTRQASLIVDPPDGRIPPLTPEAIKLAEARDAKFHLTYGGERKATGSNETWIDDVLALEDSYDSNIYDRCITRGLMGSILPGEPGGYNQGNQIIQAPGVVVIRNEMIHEARVIPLDGRPHVGSGVRTYMGDSRGHWEGNALVVETTNFLGGQVGLKSNGAGTPYSDALVITERFTRVAPNTINYEALLNDPKTYVRPWKVAFPLHESPNYQMVEYGCHEGNYALMGILRGSFAERKAAEEKAKEDKADARKAAQ